MLVLTTNRHETIHVGDDITVLHRQRDRRGPGATVVECGGGVKVVLFDCEDADWPRVGIEAPKDVAIWRTKREAECPGKNVA